MDYIFEKQEVRIEKLQKEIEDLSIEASFGVSFSPPELVIHSSIELDGSQYDQIEDVVSNHTVDLTQDEYITKIIDEASEFGMKVIMDYVKENVSLGITQLGLTNHIRKTCWQIGDALRTGSLYDAIYEIKQLDPNDFDQVILTPARILNLRNKIEEFLEISISQNWND